jgi:hypothetical protein
MVWRAPDVNADLHQPLSAVYLGFMRLSFRFSAFFFKARLTGTWGLVR